MPLPLNIILEVLTTAVRQEKIKSIQIGREEVKLTVFANNMILYVENPKVYTKELTNEFSKVAGYKITTHKSVAFLLIMNYQKEKL